MEKKILEILPSTTPKPVPIVNPVNDIPENGYLLTSKFKYLDSFISQKEIPFDRKLIYNKILSEIKDYFNIKGVIETGSIHNNTGLKTYSDLDILLCISALNIPNDSRVFLNDIYSVLHKTFGNNVSIESPAISLKYGVGANKIIDIVPVFSFFDKDYEANHGYTELPDIFEVGQFALPGSAGRWIMATPKARSARLESLDKKQSGKVKRIIRLLKSWKYYNNIPVNSYFLETFVLHLSEQFHFSNHPQLDFFKFLCSIRYHFHQEYVSVADPITNNWSVILPCKKSEFYFLQEKTDESAYFATAAIEAEHYKDLKKALSYWEIVLGTALTHYIS